LGGAPALSGTLDVPVRSTGRTVLRAAREGWLLGAAGFLIAAGAAVLLWSFGQWAPDPGDLVRFAAVVIAVAVGGLTVARERAMVGMVESLRAERARVVELEHRLEQAVGVDAAVRALSASIELDQVAGAVLDEALRLLSAGDGALLLVGDEGRLLVGASHRQELAADPEARTVEPGQGASGWVAAHRESLLITRPARGEDFAGMAPGPLESAVAVPLLVGDQLVGVLSVGTDERGRRFDPGDLFLLELLADHAALACANACHLADQRASLVALSEADRRRSDQIAMITHDLKTPLTSLIGYLNLLRKRGERGSSVDRSTFYKQMDRAARRMLEMVEDLLVSSRLEHHGQGLAREPLDLPAIVEEIRALFAGRAPDRRIEVTADPVLAPVYGDRSAVAHVLQNLVDNALKYSPAGSAVKVDVEDQPAQVLLTVTDEGGGIPAGERTGIFERFHRAAPGGPRGSVGLGLHVVKSLVAAHGGRVWCESEAGLGSRFYVTLPRRAASEAGAVGSAAEPQTVTKGTM
jgi:signal transduction histidine kinase